jgi:TatD DNase family protein
MISRQTSSLVDTHCHLNHPDFAGDLPKVLLRAEEAGVCRVICVGYDPDSSALAVHLAREIRMISAAVGVHPHDADTFSSEVEDQIRRLASEKEHVVAIGETGLDYYRNLSPKKAQQDAFRRHIGLARELELPLIVHSRDAQSDVLAILGDCGLPPRGVVMHCMPSDGEFARKALELGCYLGIAGPITFQNAAGLREIVSGLPLDSLIIETDAPYLTPHPHRGQRNEPSYVRLVAEKLAEVHGVSFGEAASITTANARKLFALEDIP